ncbi:MAG: hypothetical protein ACLPVY_10250, partial [Acidimicrobiia bacterium]
LPPRRSGAEHRRRLAGYPFGWPQPGRDLRGRARPRIVVDAADRAIGAALNARTTQLADPSAPFFSPT